MLQKPATKTWLTLDCTGEEGSGARNAQPDVQLIEKQAAAGAVGLKPFAVNDHLRNGALAHAPDDLIGGSRVLIDVDFRIGDAVFVKKLLRRPAVAAPGCRIHPHVHDAILQVFRCYHHVIVTTDEIKKLLGLEPHPVEGGFYRRTYTSRGTVALERGERAHGTAIYYLLEPGTFSEMHVLASDEIFHFYLGDPVEMLQLLPDGGSAVFTLGPDLAAGQHVQLVVPAGVWQGTRLVGDGKVALLGCTVTPGFDFADYRNASARELIAKWPSEAERIKKLTRS